jgi:hypothetical protein
MVINLALPLLNESTHVDGEPNYIVKRTFRQCQFRLCAFLSTEHTETASIRLICASRIFQLIA